MRSTNQVLQSLKYNDSLCDVESSVFGASHIINPDNQVIVKYLLKKAIKYLLIWDTRVAGCAAVICHSQCLNCPNHYSYRELSKTLWQGKTCKTLQEGHFRFDRHVTDVVCTEQTNKSFNSQITLTKFSIQADDKICQLGKYKHITVSTVAQNY